MGEHDESIVARGGQPPASARGYDPLASVQKRLESLLEAGEEGEAEELVNWLGKRLRPLLDMRMRRQVAEESLWALDDAGLLGMLDRVLKGSIEGRAWHRELLDVLTLDPAILTDLPYERVADLYNVAHRAGLHDVTRLLLRRSRSGPVTVEESDIDNEHLALPAGVRRKVAKGTDRDLLDRALRDKNPLVIGDVLDNPRLRESDVVRLAATRPTSGEILTLVASHARWSCRYGVRLALACNPHTPETIGERLIATLMAQDLTLIINGAGISDNRKQVARQRRKRLARSRA
jgi:hypothetical protein